VKILRKKINIISDLTIRFFVLTPILQVIKLRVASEERSLCDFEGK